jgi:RHS repeat-associated protein
VASTTEQTLTAETPQGSAWYLTTNRISGWGYDGAGNVTAVGSAQRTFGYDAENRQTSASVNGTSAMYAYDGEGRRVFRSVAGAGTYYAYDAFGTLVAEYGGTNGDAGTYYLTADALGSTRLVTDATGAPKLCYDYLPFGQEIGAGVDGRPANCFAADTFNTKFTGKERDAESGLDNFIARYYSSAQGRFMSADAPFNDQDPSDPQSWNLFSYVRNNPLKFTDPTGQDCIYTNNLSSEGTVGVERGNCSQSGGTFVDGTINTDSLNYSERKGTLSYSYTNGDTLGSGVIAGLPPPVQFPGIEGPANIAGADRIAKGTGPVVNALGVGTLAIAGAAGAGVAYGAYAGGAGLATLFPVLPAVPSALEKLQRLGLSLDQANRIVHSPTSQKLIDTANNGNINVIQDAGGKLVRITLDPTGQRIISAGYVQARNVANSIASGRFVAK